MIMYEVSSFDSLLLEISEHNPRGHYSEYQCYYVGIFQIVPHCSVQKSPVCVLFIH